MDNICTRFPHIILDIFKNLDSATLVNCRLVNKNWLKSIDSDILIWIRIIEKYFGHSNQYQDAWKYLLEDATFNIYQFFLKLSKHRYFFKACSPFSGQTEFLGSMLLACHKKSYLISDEIKNF